MTKKVLAVHQGFELYGSDRSFISTLEILKSNFRDIHLTIVIPREGLLAEELSKYADQLIIEDIGAITLQEGKKKPFTSLIKIFKSSLVARKRINNSNIVYINTIVPFGYLLAGLFSTQRILIHVREIPSNVLVLVFSVWFKLCGFKKFFNSNSTMNSFYFNSKNDSYVLWNGVNKLKADYSLLRNENKINLLLLGRINAMKGHIFFLKTFAQLDPKFQSQFKIFIVGDTLPGQEYYKEEIERVIFDLKLINFVTLFSFDKNPEKYFTWCDVFVIPSTKAESFGRVAIEAMSLSKPVIASNLGGLTEIVDDGKTGWLFHSNNSKDLLRILNNIIKNKNNLQDYGANSYSKFSNFFTLQCYKNNFIKIFSRFYD